MTYVTPLGVQLVPTIGHERSYAATGYAERREQHGNMTTAASVTGRVAPHASNLRCTPTSLHAPGPLAPWTWPKKTTGTFAAAKMGSYTWRIASPSFV